MAKHEEDEIKPRDLQDVTVSTVGLVRKGANRKKFFIIKSDDETDQEDNSMTDNIESVLESLEEIRENPTLWERLTKVFKDDTTEEKRVEKEEPAKVEEPALPAEVVAKLEKMELLEKSHNDLKDEVQKAHDELSKERDRRARAEFVRKAESYTYIPANSQELGEFMHLLSGYIAKDDAHGDKLEWFEAFLKSVNATLRDAGVFEEFGTSRTAEELTVLEKAQKLIKDGDAQSIKEALLSLPVDEAEQYVRSRQQALSPHKQR